MSYCNNKFWTENFIELFCKSDIIPLSDETIENQLNALTRLVLFIFLCILLFNTKVAVIFFIFAIFYILIEYYRYKRNKKIQYTYKENFTMETNKKSCGKNGQNGQKNTGSYYKKLNLSSSSKNPIIYYSQEKIDYNPNNASLYKGQRYPVRTKPLFCDDSVNLNVNDPNYTSINQKLVGNSNPKTLINPIIPSPLADLEYWKNNNITKLSVINSSTQFDPYNSGYFYENCDNECSNIYNPATSNFTNPMNKTIYNDNICSDYYTNNGIDTQNMYNDIYNDIIEDVIDIPKDISKNVKENFTCDTNNKNDNNCRYLPNSNDIDNSNKNLYTQTIQPGIYSYNQVIEPINSNIGITYTEQIHPITKNVNNLGIMYDEHTPNVKLEKREFKEGPNEQNIYDPRFTGYGTSYRSYTDNFMGNTKYFYDDVDSVRMPNYITRNHLDFTDYAPTYGPKRDIDYTKDIRTMAYNTFIDNTNNFRADLQETLMRKRNNELWQLRQAPINTNGVRMLK